MAKHYLSYNNITTSLGFDTATVFNRLKNQESAIKFVDDPKRFYTSFYGSIIPSQTLNSDFKTLERKEEFTRLEKMILSSLSKTIQASGIEIDGRVGLIISTTKGNIDVLQKNSNFPEGRAYLHRLGEVVKAYFDFKHEAIVISNACVSGVLAVAIAKRYLQEEVYDHIFIVAGDVISDFVISGFNSFHALSPSPCQPYDQNRKGINLGEAAVSVLVTSDKKHLSEDAVEILGEGSCNDANHISGPSRTGEGLYRSIKMVIKEAHIDVNDIHYMSTHGTATPFNDEMEAIALDRMRLNHIPLNSLKGYFGHTLGASGLLETIIGMQSLQHNTLIASAGFRTLGVSKPLNIIKETTPATLKTFLKTASGFGGCNTAVIFKKVAS